jgi:hypothetical protein
MAASSPSRYASTCASKPGCVISTPLLVTQRLLEATGPRDALIGLQEKTPQEAGLFPAE